MALVDKTPVTKSESGDPFLLEKKSKSISKIETMEGTGSRLLKEWENRLQSPLVQGETPEKRGGGEKREQMTEGS